MAFLFFFFKTTVRNLFVLGKQDINTSLGTSLLPIKFSWVPCVFSGCTEDLILPSVPDNNTTTHFSALPVAWLACAFAPAYFTKACDFN